jgi:hypothetical protein
MSDILISCIIIIIIIIITVTIIIISAGNFDVQRRWLF